MSTKFAVFIRLQETRKAIYRYWKADKPGKYIGNICALLAQALKFAHSTGNHRAASETAATRQLKSAR